MKRVIILSIVLFAIVSVSNAQSAFSKGDNLVNVGVGLGGSLSGFSSSLPVGISYERGITDAIGVGGQLMYASTKVDGIKVTATFLGARGAYHFGTLLNIPEKFDVYGGIIVGYAIVSVSDGLGDSYTGTSQLGYGLFAGGKYYFSPKFAAFAELGIQSLSDLNIGVSFKF